MSDPKELTEIKQEQLMTILKLVEEGKVTFVHTEKPDRPVVNKEELKRLFWNTSQRRASEDPVRMIRIRCDRTVNQWALYDERGKKAISHFTCGVIKDATLSSKEIPAAGCGGADYIGMASGDMISPRQPLTVPTGQVHRLVFDRYAGHFIDSVTQNEITRVDYLILKEGCHAEYIRA